MRVLVTGAAGFIGAKTVELLMEAGQSVVGIDNLNDYYDIDWPKVVLPFMKGGMKLTKGYKKVVEKRTPKNFVCHWDVCLNSKSCARVLNKRGI